MEGRSSPRSVSRERNGQGTGGRALRRGRVYDRAGSGLWVPLWRLGFGAEAHVIIRWFYPVGIPVLNVIAARRSAARLKADLNPACQHMSCDISQLPQDFASASCLYASSSRRGESSQCPEYPFWGKERRLVEATRPLQRKAVGGGWKGEPGRGRDVAEGTAPGARMVDDQSLLRIARADMNPTHSTVHCWTSINRSRRWRRLARAGRGVQGEASVSVQNGPVFQEVGHAAAGTSPVASLRC